MVPDVIPLFERNGYVVALSYKQIIIMAVTAGLLAVFWYVVQKTPLGRVLISHNVLRHIDLGAVLRITAGRLTPPGRDARMHWHHAEVAELVDAHV